MAVFVGVMPEGLWPHMGGLMRFFFAGVAKGMGQCFPPPGLR